MKKDIQNRVKCDIVEKKDKKMEQILKDIVQPMINWYQKQEKVLPWKQDKEPYHIWISEIMLQQTRIEAVKNYYIRFMEQLPSVNDLANIPEETLLKLWEGLGYYSRAKNLKKAAIQIVEQYKGMIPTTYAELIKLPGIGEYTAGAIASICYQEKVPAIDGNVLRVISRVLASQKDVLLSETKKEISKQLLGIMPKEAGDFNEGLMELGERVCLPNTKPLCEKCPIQQNCLAYQKDLTSVLPVRVKKQKRKIETKTVFIVKYCHKIAVRKRSNTGILANLYEFPNVNGEILENEISHVLKKWGVHLKELKKQKRDKHIFTHIQWNMIVYEVEVKDTNALWEWITQQDMDNKYPLPTAFKKLLFSYEK